MTQSDPTSLPDPTRPPSYFSEALQDAERLLTYAAEMGIDVDPEIRTAILHARSAYPGKWTEDIAAKLLAALTRLAAHIRPVTAASLKAYHADTRATVHTYFWVAIILACVIVPVSIASFVSSAVSNAITKDMATANDLAVKLRTQLGSLPLPTPRGASVPPLPPGVNDTEVISELQEYASTIRVIYARSRELHRFVITHDKAPFEDDMGDPNKRRARFELEPPIVDVYHERDKLTGTYQEVRNFAQNMLNDASVFYGAITTCILPVLYALLGTCAFLLRSFEDQMSTRTFTPSVANSARFLIAGIGGAVVGLFNNFNISGQASIPPLAIAFLVGYAVDVFFAFLEGLLRAFSKTTNPSASPPVAAALNPGSYADGGSGSLSSSVGSLHKAL